jgi:hypothetical protein
VSGSDVPKQSLTKHYYTFIHSRKWFMVQTPLCFVLMLLGFFTTHSDVPKARALLALLQWFMVQTLYAWY